VGPDASLLYNTRARHASSALPGITRRILVYFKGGGGEPAARHTNEDFMTNSHVPREVQRNSRGKNAVLVAIILALTANVILVTRYVRYKEETGRLRAGMTTAQRERADAVVAAERHRLRVEFELVRRQARGDRQLHLSVNVDSGRMVLERDGVVLRDMSVRIGPERLPGARGDSSILVSALGLRTVERVLSQQDSWALPSTVFVERGLPVPDDLRVRGALGDDAIVLDEGTVVYAVPESGPLADTAYVLPGSVQLAAADLKALSASIRPGMAVYFYK
jgi:hypothetical protein